MPISKDHLVDVLRVRYDAYSAEAVFTQACARAGLDGTTSFDQRSLASFRVALDQVGDRVGGVLARIDALLDDGAPATPEPNVETKAEKKAKTKPEPKAEPTAETKPETKAEPTAETKAEPTAEKSAAPTPEKAAETTIVLRGLEVDKGEEVLVCGASPTIGDWDPERAAPMVRVDDEWLAMLELPPDAEVAFKFLVRDPSGEVTWEAGGNRTVRANERLDATWRELS